MMARPVVGAREYAQVGSMIRDPAAEPIGLPGDPLVRPSRSDDIAKVRRQVAVGAGDPPPRHRGAVEPHHVADVTGPGADQLGEVAIRRYPPARDLLGGQQDAFHQEFVHVAEYVGYGPERTAGEDGRSAPTGNLGLADLASARLRSGTLRSVRVHLGCDHAGLELKGHLKVWLRGRGHEPVDYGPFEFDPEDDYPGFCIRAAVGVATDLGSGIPAAGIVIGGSGNGEQMAANKVRGIRCALVWSEETATLARAHNDAQVISVGGRLHGVEDVTRFVETFLSTPFSEGERHRRRIAQVAEYEATGRLPEAAGPR
jgi:ribose 5-phosphate isomerase B